MSCDPDDWPEPPASPWGPRGEAPTVTGDVHHVWLLDVTAEDLDADEQRRREQAWDRTGFGLRP